MTNEEALVKLKEIMKACIKTEAADLDDILELHKMFCEAPQGQVRIEEVQNEIFLLSAEEYEKYKDNIPHLNTWWWLRSPGGYSHNAVCVSNYGYVNSYGYHVSYNDYAVRPALKIPNLKVGEKIVKYGCTWIGIDKGLAISEVPIGFEKFDDESNNYENSYIRKWLLDWVKEREKND